MTPASTYRLQLHKEFTFYDAANIAEYLKALGVSHVYSSPYLQAAPGSMHGYDVVDHRHVNKELGGDAGHKHFCSTLGDAGLGQVLDIVPNHMSLAEENQYWRDVLENGTSSRYAGFFDIDWNSPEERLRDKVLVPILPGQYGCVLEDGGIVLKRSGSGFTIEASGQTLPVSSESLAPLLDRAAGHAKNDTLKFLAASLLRLPRPKTDDRRAILERHRDKLVLFQMLGRLCSEDKKVCSAIDHRVAEINVDADALDDFLNQQHYRLAYWKASDQQLGYRRFFDVNTLVGLRVEREYVFDETHGLVLDWLKRGVLDGVRVDHPDGLRDPQKYFARLRKRAPHAWIVGEKILARGEWLRSSWPIEGTSGYDFLNMAIGVLADREGVARLVEEYAAFTGEPTDFPTVAHDKKVAVTKEALASDVNRLTGIFISICESNRKYRDFTRAEVRRAVRELVSCFGIYRTYVVPERDEITDEDRSVLDKAIESAKGNKTDLDPALFNFIGDVLKLRVRGESESEFVHRFQQFTSPVMAKGVEDTAFYCYNPMLALNEVGGDPAYRGVSVDEFHRYNETMQAEHPETMLALSTHDTKRSDDVRARLAVLSEVPAEFAAAVTEWSEVNREFRSGRFPDPGTEWFLFQTLVGAWPIDVDRMKQYMQKAMREAKAHTSWVANNEEYESALNRYIDCALAHRPFVAKLDAFVASIQLAGRTNSLSQTLMKYTAPGVPDLYQGGELWDFSLVDPDNRRPVDYDLRRKLLDEMKDLDVSAVMARMDEALPKLWLVHHCLRLRNEHREWFGREAAYEAMHVRGAKQSHVIAWKRGSHLITVAPRLLKKLGSNWADTSIEVPAGTWRDELTGQTVRSGTQLISDLLAKFPVALLVRVDGKPTQQGEI